MKNDNPAPAPGIYYDVPFREYTHWNAVNNSSLTAALKSADHYRMYCMTERPDTDAFKFGRLCHEGRLEPAAALNRYAVMPDLTEGIMVGGKPAKNPKSTKEYKERVADWSKYQTGKEIVTADEYKRFCGVLNSLWMTQRSRDWFSCEGRAEVSIIWEDTQTGVLCKARIDRVIADGAFLVDLKTTRDATEFESSIARYNYHRQAAFYLDGWRTVTGRGSWFGFAAVESESPFGVRAAPISVSMVLAGRAQYLKALRTVAWCRSNPEKAGGYKQPEVWDLPTWASPDNITVTIEGQSHEYQ